MTIEVKRSDSEFPYVEKNGNLLPEEITKLEQQHNMKLISIKNITDTKTRYGFKKGLE